MKNFDWPHNIKLVSITAGGTNQSTGDYDAPGEVETDIKAHIIDLSIKDLQRMPEGMYAIGDRRIICDKIYGVTPIDNIKITEADSSVTDWEVKEREKSYAMIGKFAGEDRESFLLKKIA